MEKLYNRTYWKNAPDKTTPLNAENLDNMEAGIDANDDRIVQLSGEVAVHQYAEGCHFIKEIFINNMGVAADVATMHLVYGEQRYLMFSNSAQDTFVAKTDSNVDTNGIIPILSMDGSDVFGYIIVDWSTLVEVNTRPLNYKAFNLSYSPTIKSYVEKLEAPFLGYVPSIVVGGSDFENLNPPQSNTVSATSHIWFQYTDKNKKITEVNRIEYVSVEGTTNFYKVTYSEGETSLKYELIASVKNSASENFAIKSIRVNVTLEENQYIGVNGAFAFHQNEAGHYTRNYDLANGVVGLKQQQSLLFNSKNDASLDSRIARVEKRISSRNRAVVLYNSKLKSSNDDIIGEQAFNSHGLIVDGRLVLNKYYSVSDRTVKYVCKFSNDTVALFESVIPSGGSYNANTALRVDVANGIIQVGNLDPRYCKLLNGTDEFIISITKHYLDYVVNIYNTYTGQSFETTWKNNGAGGAGEGAVGNATATGMQYDYYALNLESGSSYSVAQIIVNCAKCDLLIYGDSISEPEAYYPADIFDKSWTQLVIDEMNGRAMTSGRSGTAIHQIMERIENELPYIKPKYCMVTIGTNGGSTVENLTSLVQYIKSQGVIPILNHIPCYNNDGDTSGFITVNEYVDTVRQNEGVNGCDFDIATSINHDGQSVDTSMMWLETYPDGSVYYHHPNTKGASAMFARLLLDVPEIFE